jgi:hypothetical protein
MTAAIGVMVGFALLTYLLAIYLYLFIKESPNSLDWGMTEFLMVVLWFNLSVALLLAGIRSGMPRWSAITAVPAIFMAVGAAISMHELLEKQPVRWMIVAPALIPLIKDSRLEAEKREEVGEPLKERLAQFKHIPPDAPVRDWLPFLNYSETREETIAKIRSLKHKESDFEQLMNSGDYTVFDWLYQFELSPTPGLCEGARRWLREKSIALKPAPENASYRDIAPINKGRLQTLTSFASQKCPMLEEVKALEATLLSYPGGKDNDPRLFDRLDKIKGMLQER